MLCDGHEAPRHESTIACRPAFLQRPTARSQFPRSRNIDVSRCQRSAVKETVSSVRRREGAKRLTRRGKRGLVRAALGKETSVSSPLCDRTLVALLCVKGDCLPTARAPQRYKS